VVSDLKPILRWSNGIAVRYKETKILLDPLESDPAIPDLFISDAHHDHARGFEFPVQKKYSTEETREIHEANTGRKVGNWQQIRHGRRIRVGDVEVEAHDAGHVLGAAQYEIITPESIIVYASHLNLTDTLLLRAAEITPCDLLLIETSPSLQAHQPRETVIADLVKWALECIRDQRIPAFEVDVIGNAQELVRVFNTWTEIPVIAHPRIARINRVYESKGIDLRYIDASTDEASEMVEQSRCVVLFPRGFDTSRYGNFRTAYVRATPVRPRNAQQKLFHLGDQADMTQLIQYVQEARPRSVLSCYGASQEFAQIVSRRLGIPAGQLATEVRRRKPAPMKLDGVRISRCQETILKAMEVPDFTYEKRDLMALGLREGFRSQEIEEALLRLTRNGVLKYSGLLDGYSRE
jgi:hypothetical protein